MPYLSFLSPFQQSVCWSAGAAILGSLQRLRGSSDQNSLAHWIWKNEHFRSSHFSFTINRSSATDLFSDIFCQRLQICSYGDRGLRAGSGDDRLLGRFVLRRFPSRRRVAPVMCGRATKSGYLASITAFSHIGGLAASSENFLTNFRSRVVEGHNCLGYLHIDGINDRFNIERPLQSL